MLVAACAQPSWSTSVLFWSWQLVLCCEIMFKAWKIFRNINILPLLKCSWSIVWFQCWVISVLCFFEGAIKIPTVSRSPEDLNTTAMAEFGTYIQKGTELPLFHFSNVCCSLPFSQTNRREHISFLNIREQIFIFFLKKGLSGMSHVCPLCNSVLGVSMAPKSLKDFL